MGVTLCCSSGRRYGVAPAWFAAFVAVVLVSSVFNVCARPVDEAAASRVAQNIAGERFSAKATAAGLAVSKITPLTESGVTVLYAIDLAPAGLVIVAADDVSLPVIYYSAEAHWDEPDTL